MTFRTRNQRLLGELMAPPAAALAASGAAKPPSGGSAGVPPAPPAAAPARTSSIMVAVRPWEPDMMTFRTRNQRLLGELTGGLRGRGTQK